MSDLNGNHEDRFSLVAAHLKPACFVHPENQYFLMIGFLDVFSEEADR